jgi:CRISPR-associated Csx14 family protein
MVPGNQVLVATLGTRPQVITLALDLLAEDKDVYVGEVYVIHTSGDRVLQALKQLEGEFPGGRYRGESYRDRRGDCELELVPILTPKRAPVYDIRSREDADSTFRTIYGTIRQQKDAGRTVHFSVAGGRNSMVAYGAAVAQKLFDAKDRLWHIISTRTFEESGAMHRDESGPGQAFLAPIPVQSWNEFLRYAIDMWVGAEDPSSAFDVERLLIQRQSDSECEAFLERLSGKERELVADFVMHGGTSREIAARLGKSPRTVDTQFSDIYDKLSEFIYETSEEIVSVGRETVMKQFAGFFERNPHLKPPPEK